MRLVEVLSPEEIKSKIAYYSKKRIDPGNPKMMPGQEPYTKKELKKVYGMVGGAADQDPGEGSEEENKVSWRHYDAKEKKGENAVPLSTMKRLRRGIDSVMGDQDESEDISLGQQALAIIDGITGTGKGMRDLRRSDFKQKFAELRDIVSKWLSHEKGEQMQVSAMKNDTDHELSKHNPKTREKLKKMNFQVLSDYDPDTELELSKHDPKTRERLKKMDFKVL